MNVFISYLICIHVANSSMAEDNVIRERVYVCARIKRKGRFFRTGNLNLLNVIIKRTQKPTRRA